MDRHRIRLMLMVMRRKYWISVCCNFRFLKNLKDKIQSLKYFLKKGTISNSIQLLLRKFHIILTNDTKHMFFPVKKKSSHKTKLHLIEWWMFTQKTQTKISSFKFPSKSILQCTYFNVRRNACQPILTT